MKKILIVEDDVISRKYLSKILEKYGECDLVVDGLEAIDAYLMAIKDKVPYDLICLDIMMPKIDGVKVLKAIRGLEVQNGLTEENRSKIIMTTALAETRIVQNAFALGCDDYVSKPIDQEMLVKSLELIGFIQQ